MTLRKRINLFVLAALITGGLLGTGLASPAQTFAAAGGGPHVQVFDSQTSNMLEDDAGEEELADEGSSDSETEPTTSHSDVEWRYVNVRR